MMKPTIEFCASNMHHGTDRIMKELEQSCDVEVIEYGCLGNCGECYLSPYAYVNGEIVASESIDQLRSDIFAVIKRQAADQEALDRIIDDLD